MSAKLNFEEFENQTLESWKAKVIKELKGKDFSETEWRTEDDILMSALYQGQERALSGEYEKSNGFLIHQSISEDNSTNMNKLLLESLQGGVESIGIDCEIRSDEKLRELLDSIQTDIVSVNFSKKASSPYSLLAYIEYNKERGIELESLNGGISYSPLNGIFNSEEEANWKKDLKELALIWKYNLSSFRIIEVDAVIAHNQGASVAEELAFALSMGHDYLLFLMEEGFSAEEASKMMRFNFAYGVSYLEDLSKFRVFRSLWSNLLDAYGVKQEDSSTYIHAKGGNYFRSTLDLHNNILRSTTGAMSAVLGSCDSVEVNPHDELSERKESNAYRVARNILHLLREESYLSVGIDPVKGSYFIEELENSIAEKAWSIFKESEAQGGFLSSMQINFFADLFKENRNGREERFRNQDLVMVGVNKYANKEEKAHTPSADAQKEDRLSSNQELELLKSKIAL